MSDLIRSALLTDTLTSLLLTVSSVSVLLIYIGLVGAYGKHLGELCGSHRLGKLWAWDYWLRERCAGPTQAPPCAAPWHVCLSPELWVFLADLAFYSLTLGFQVVPDGTQQSSVSLPSPVFTRRHSSAGASSPFSFYKALLYLLG